MPRFIIAFVISLAITLGLFFLMQSLIKMGGSALTEPPKGSVLDFVRVKKGLNKKTVNLGSHHRQKSHRRK